MTNVQTLFAQMIPNLRVVGACFKDINGQPVGKVYHYKTMDDTIEVGDELVVDTPSCGMSIVVAVDIAGPEVLTANSGINFKWIVQRVDRTKYNALLDNDAKVAQTIALAAKAAAVRKAQEELKSLLADAGIGDDDMGGLNDLLNSYKGD